MTPWYSSGGVEIRVGHVLDVLAELEAGSVQTVVTSPPYYGLRAYNTAPVIWGGSPDCTHQLAATTPGKVLTGGTGTASAKQVSNNGSQYGNAWVEETRPGVSGGTAASTLWNERPAEQQTYNAETIVERRSVPPITSATCTRCGAWRGELGSEPIPDCLAWARGQEPCSVCFVCHLVTVFRAVRRVLHDSGTCWVNLGDSYAADHAQRRLTMPEGQVNWGLQSKTVGSRARDERGTPPGMKPKNLMMMPARVALALQSDGWVLWSAITWAKKSPMPESVRDRPTNATEMVYLLAKNPSYYYDADAVRQSPAPSVVERAAYGVGGTKLQTNGDRHDGDKGQRTTCADYQGGANLRNFWLLGPAPYPNAHFATFVPEIPRLAVLAGTSARGQCPACGAPWRRVVAREHPPRGVYQDNQARIAVTAAGGGKHAGIPGGQALLRWHAEHAADPVTTWEPSCTCPPHAPVPQTVLDPFLGSGTTAYVARHHGRRAIGIELNAEYAKLANDRLKQGTLGLEVW